jgi:hypothetical protein
MDSERDPQKERMRTREVGEGAESDKSIAIWVPT